MLERGTISIHTHAFDTQFTPNSQLMLVLSEESMGGKIYYMDLTGGWRLAKDFNPCPGAFAFVTDKDWIASFHTQYGPWEEL